mmetsp:Transcript_21276/g.31546  ORF Transcript_21276/g.31546 Transcript_21276/m.31546 type:complete len:203 (-) Transcript_21276:848-1456(-)
MLQLQLKQMLGKLRRSQGKSKIQIPPRPRNHPIRSSQKLQIKTLQQCQIMVMENPKLNSLRRSKLKILRRRIESRAAKRAKMILVTQRMIHLSTERRISPKMRKTLVKEIQRRKRSQLRLQEQKPTKRKKNPERSKLRNLMLMPRLFRSIPVPRHSRRVRLLLQRLLQEQLKIHINLLLTPILECQFFIRRCKDSLTICTLP